MISSDEGLEARFTMEGERGGVIDEPPFRLLVLADLSGDGAKKDVSCGVRSRSTVIILMRYFPA